MNSETLSPMDHVNPDEKPNDTNLFETLDDQVDVLRKNNLFYSTSSGFNDKLEKMFKDISINFEHIFIQLNTQDVQNSQINNYLKREFKIFQHLQNAYWNGIQFEKDHISSQRKRKYYMFEESDDNL